MNMDKIKTFLRLCVVLTILALPAVEVSSAQEASQEADEETDDFQRKNAELVGSMQEILVEGPSKNNQEKLSGRTGQNRIVIIEGDATRMTGQIIPVKIEESTGFTLYGTPVIHTSW